ncbi:MAG: SEC-C domain-containing protein [Endomicrobium sp.]|nr:SEC-C domain-containing protein [Endomicrobium sp.]
MEKIKKSEGVNESERMLVKLGKKVFLELWSYPNVYYEPGKELTDLLVICDNYILIFSDKKVKFDDSKDLKLAWQRWHNRAIIKSIKQLRKAEHRIKTFPNNLFLDSKCKQKLPISLPSLNDMEIHLICIANGAKDACKKYFGEGCTGSLRFSTDLSELKDLHLPTEFCVTDDKTQTFVHIFDDFSFPFILNELDTLTDFVNYLEEKEVFIRKAKGVSYTGEEDLLYNYVKNLDNKRNRHTFISEDKKIEDTFFYFPEGNWNNLKENPQYKARKQADEISYLWDDLIQKTGLNKLNGTIISEKPAGSTHEGALRYMALENRVLRRDLALKMKQAFDSYPSHLSCESSFSYVRYKETSFRPYASLSYVCQKSEQAYFFLQLKPLVSESYNDYRHRRKGLLEIYAICLKAKFVCELPERPLKRIIGIGMEPPKYSDTISEQFLLLDCSEWTDEQQAEYSNWRSRLNIWRTPLKQANKVHIKEYPEIQKRKKIGRNDPCPCGSGKKYKKCCLNI